MSRQPQDQNYQSGHYQTSYQYPPQQHGQSPQPPLNTYDDRRPSHHVHTSYPEGSVQHPPSGQGHGSRSPYVGTVSSPEPNWQNSTASPPPPYFPSSQTTQNLSVAPHHQHGRRSSHGHPPPTGSSSDSHRLPATDGSYTGGGSNFYSQPGVQPHPEGGHTASDMQTQDWGAAEHEEPDVRTKAPRVTPFGTNRHRPCRFPGCNAPVFFDRRVNELREWCSDVHMQAAIVNRVEKPCKACQVWPRRNGYKNCSGDYCGGSGSEPVGPAVVTISDALDFVSSLLSSSY